MHTVVLLTEEALVEDDATYLRGLRGEDEQVVYHVLVPADTERNLLVSVLDGLALGDLRDTLEDVKEGGRTAEPVARAEAAEALSASQAALAAAGVSVTGQIVADDPIESVRQEVRRLGADEVQVVTRPHLVEDSFRQDWASRARRELGVPVLHIYSGTHGWIA